MKLLMIIALVLRYGKSNMEKLINSGNDRNDRYKFNSFLYIPVYKILSN